MKKTVEEKNEVRNMENRGNRNKEAELRANVLSHYEDNENGGDFKSCYFCTDYECYRCKYALLDKFLSRVCGDDKTPRDRTISFMDLSAPYKVVKAVYSGLTKPYKGFLDEDISDFS